MSATACIAYYGIRFEIGCIEIDGLESRADPRVVAATSAGLEHFWTNCDAPGERNLLFIGAELAILGLENQSEVVIRSSALDALMTATRAKLHAAGIEGEPSLYLQWVPDA